MMAMMLIMAPRSREDFVRRYFSFSFSFLFSAACCSFPCRTGTLLLQSYFVLLSCYHSTPLAHTAYYRPDRICFDMLGLVWRTAQAWAYEVEVLPRYAFIFLCHKKCTQYYIPRSRITIYLPRDSVGSFLQPETDFPLLVAGHLHP